MNDEQTTKDVTTKDEPVHRYRLVQVLTGRTLSECLMTTADALAENEQLKADHRAERWAKVKEGK